MNDYAVKGTVDHRLFDPNANLLEARYGLPPTVVYCKRCVISNQRPSSEIEFKHHIATKKRTIHIDAEGVCDACRANDAKAAAIDWKSREEELRRVCDKYRRNDGHYDCLVPGSGGKDSIKAAHIIKHKYGMHPLTVTWAPGIYTDWGWKNHQAWIHAGFDNFLFTPNGRNHRLLCRLAVENLFHPFQPFILGQKGFAPKMAIKMGLPLVFFGENEAEYGNPRSDMNAAKRDWSYFTAHDRSELYLGGVSLADLSAKYGMSEVDLAPFLPSDPAEIEKHKIEVHYIGYYEKWHPQGSYYYSIEHSDFQAAPERTTGTYSKYNSIDDKIDDFHYWTTYIKFGIGRATYDASQEVRNGEITREEGVALIKRFDGEWPERFAEEFFRYLSIDPKEFPVAAKMFEQPIMTREYFLKLADSFRSPHIWKFADGQWQLRNAIDGRR